MAFFTSSSLSSSRTLLSLLLVIAVALSQTVTIAKADDAVAAAKTITIGEWYLPYTGPETVVANVGDTITFEWDAGHNVYIHPTMDCNLDGAIYVGDTSPTSYTFTEADGSADGTDMYFACDIGDGAHCQAGQNLIATVYSGDGDSGSADAASGDADADAATTSGDAVAPVETDSSSTTTTNEAPVESDVGTVPPAADVMDPSSSSNCNNNNNKMMIVGMMVISFMMLFR